MRPLVSILIPAYNAEKTIAQTLQSAIAQTWPRKEIIVVDDGSTDRTVEVVRRFGSRVTLVSTENRGGQAARNHAYSLCHGDYIQWLDADDLLAPDKLERQLAALQGSDSRKILLSSAWGTFYYRTSRARFIPTPLWQDLSPIEWFIHRFTEYGSMQTCCWLTSRYLADTAGPWDTDLLVNQDGEYFARVVLASEAIRFVPGTGSLYRLSDRNRTSYIGNSDKKKASLLRTMELYIQYIRSLEDSERVRRACLTFLQPVYPAFWDQPDYAAKLQNLAAQLQGRLEEPRLRWKYAWMKPVFGWKAAKWAQTNLPRLREEFKASWLRSYDRMMYWLEGDQFCFNPESERDISSYT